MSHRYTTCICIYVYIYVHDKPSRSHTDTQNTCTNTNSTNSLILLPSLDEQDGVPLVRIYMCMYVQHGCLQQLGSHTQSAQQPPLNPSLSSCWQLGVYALKVLALLQLLVRTITHTHTASPTESLTQEKSYKGI